MPVKEKVDVRDEIKQWLDANERTLGWLSKKTNYSYHTLYSILKLKTVQISDAKLKSINTLLETKFKK